MATDQDIEEIRGSLNALSLMIEMALVDTFTKEERLTIGMKGEGFNILLRELSALISLTEKGTLLNTSFRKGMLDAVNKAINRITVIQGLQRWRGS